MDYKIPEHTIFREVDGKAIALNLDTGQYYTMNELGTRVWELLQANKPAAEIVETIELEYDAESEQIASDLAAFLSDLYASGLVEQD